MIYELIFTSKADETFNSIKSQLFNKWGKRGVIKLQIRTAKVLQIISSSPLIYQAIDESSSVRMAYIHKNCSLFYKVTDNKITILFFWDNRQDPIF